MTPEQLLTRICIMYGLNLPTLENKILILNYFNTQTYGYGHQDILNAVESNLSGKTGQILKPFNKELTIIFLAEIFDAYKPLFENEKYEQRKNQLKLEPNIDDSKQKFIDETLASWDNLTLEPKFFHYNCLVDNKRVKPITDEELNELKKITIKSNKNMSQYEKILYGNEGSRIEAIEIYLKNNMPKIEIEKPNENYYDEFLKIGKTK